MINLTVVRITMRGLLGRRRFLLLLPLPAFMVGLAVLIEAVGVEATDWVEPIAVGLGFVVVVPVLALIVTASVLGSEIEDGTVLHILSKPLPRREIVLSKLLVAVAATTVAVGAAMLLTGLIAGSGRLGIGLLAGTVVGAVAYCALFLALCLLTRRPVLIGLAYILIWEGLLGNLVPGTRLLSIQQYAIAVAEWAAGTAPFAGQISAPVSLAMAAGITVGATLLATDRLRSFAVTGDTG
jgi:ABC-2 type transport system permease protein